MSLNMGPFFQNFEHLISCEYWPLFREKSLPFYSQNDPLNGYGFRGWSGTPPVQTKSEYPPLSLLRMHLCYMMCLKKQVYL